MVVVGQVADVSAGAADVVDDSCLDGAAENDGGDDDDRSDEVDGVVVGGVGGVANEFGEETYLSEED